MGLIDDLCDSTDAELARQAQEVMHWKNLYTQDHVIVLDQIDELARLRARVTIMEEERDDLLRQRDERDKAVNVDMSAEAERDSLAAENRLMQRAIHEVAFDEMGNCILCADASDSATHASHCPVGEALSSPHASRDAQRVRALEVVGEAVRLRCREAVPQWAPEIRGALAALDLLSEERKGKT